MSYCPAVALESQIHTVYMLPLDSQWIKLHLEIVGIIQLFVIRNTKISLADEKKLVSINELQFSQHI